MAENKFQISQEFIDTVSRFVDRVVDRNEVYTIADEKAMNSITRKVEKDITPDSLVAFKLIIVNGDIPVLVEFLIETGMRYPATIHIPMKCSDPGFSIIYKIYSIHDIAVALNEEDKSFTRSTLTSGNYLKRNQKRNMLR